MGIKLNLVGQTFGLLTVTSFHGMTQDRMVRLWDCSCSCGGSIVVPTKRLRNGMTRSCGCLLSTVLVKRNTKHGKSKTGLYAIWEAMMSRCYNPHNHAFNRYGGRGIYVSPEWHDFQNFYDAMSPRPEGLTLDRKDVNGPYSADNCRWATYLEQNGNRRDNVLVLLPDGTTTPLSEAARRLGASVVTVRKHLRLGSYRGAVYAPSNS